MAVLQILNHGKVLIAVAAEIEARAVFAGLGATLQPNAPAWRLLPARDRIDVVLTGVGKAAAAGAVSRVLDPTAHTLVLSVGIAGTYTHAPLGSVVAATESIFADEGVQTDAGFDDLARIGFPPLPGGMSVRISDPVLASLSPHAHLAGPIATVSTCSGTDALALTLQHRTRAIAEAMEGAAVGLVAQRLAVPFGELRAISNTTGNRSRQVWNVKDALAALSAVIGRVFEGV